MSITTRIKNHIKNFSLREATKRFAEIMIILTIADMLISPQDGLGKIAIDIIGFVPTEIYVGLTALLVIWFGLSSIDELDDKVRDVPFPVMIASILGTVYFTTQYVLTISILSNGMVGGTINTVFGILLGGVIWFVGTLAVTGIAMSILGVDPTENRIKNTNTDDAYNDKHAAEILNQDESSDT